MRKTESKKRRTTDATAILDRQMEGNAMLRQQADAALVNADVAQQIYDLRVKSQLTQQQLAELVGTTQSVIARLEDADYEGHSLSMLQRIASALNQRLQIRFVAGNRKVAA